MRHPIKDFNINKKGATDRKVSKQMQKAKCKRQMKEIFSPSARKLFK
jgi:hypothetical protein